MSQSYSTKWYLKMQTDSEYIKSYKYALQAKRSLPMELRKRIGYGLYGGTIQFYIKGVDGFLAQLGTKLPSVSELHEDILNADTEHLKLMKQYNLEKRGNI